MAQTIEDVTRPLVTSAFETSSVFTPSTTIYQVLRIMRDNTLPRLPVVERGIPVGIVSMAQLAKWPARVIHALLRR